MDMEGWQGWKVGGVCSVGLLVVHLTVGRHVLVEFSRLLTPHARLMPTFT
jgi:hypothetical protein